MRFFWALFVHGILTVIQLVNQLLDTAPWYHIPQ